MAPISIGFVLVTHSNVSQTAVLCRRLNAMFDYPPIAIHHDFDQVHGSLVAIPSNVHVVQDWIRTSWAGATVVDANLRALRLLMQRADPDWIISLSNACYPIKTAGQITKTLVGTSADGYLSHELITYDSVRDRSEPDRARPVDPFWRSDCLRRYLAVSVPKRIMILLGQKDRELKIENFTLTKWFTPFHNELQCYCGDAWYTLRRPAALALLESTETARKLRRHYQDRFCPDESYYHTILLNNKTLRIVNQCLTYIDWNSGGAHPKTLGYEDFPKLLSSDSLFARKFPLDERLLQDLDAAAAAAPRQKTHSTA